MAVQVGLGGAYGRMGETIRDLADQYEDVFVALTFDPNGGDYDAVTAYDGDLSADIDVYMDFTQADSVVENVQYAAEHGVDSVVGTTGWDDRRADVDALAEEYGVRVLAGSNFSYGANTFFDTVATAAERLDGEQWDAGIVETHHVHKEDAPSGTALTLFDILNAHLWEDDPDPADKVGSTRAGEIPGEHRVRFTNTATGEEHLYRHRASGTDDFGRGTIRALQAFYDAEREPGLYDFSDDIFGPD